MSLQTVAQQMVASGKGILAADESSGTIEKKFAKIGLASTEDTRRAYREMLFTSPRIGDYISGVILFDETIKQNASDGRTMVSILQSVGVLPGIKVDQGTAAMDVSPEEKVTKGLDGLGDRLKEYASLGAVFAKWRAVITIGDPPAGGPTDGNILRNAQDLAAYALECQKAGIVPMVEPEVLMDGSHTLEKCVEASERTLKSVFEELTRLGVDTTGMILKTNMMVPGKESGQKATPQEVADATIKVFKDVLPDDLPGQAFLSGGQSDVEATANLDAINKNGPFPWKLSFSYGRALQDSALKAWNGKAENVTAAQNVFLHRAKMNSLATLGKYEGE
ncbi:MAG: class I fructose-bisphosphate aldolase [bacterium]|nr:class I fructose-bisphosphate aldolase [bacterium]